MLNKETAVTSRDCLALVSQAVLDMQLAEYRVTDPAHVGMLAPADVQNRRPIKQQLEVQKVNQLVQQVCNNSIDANVKAFTSSAQNAKTMILTAI